MATLSPFMPRTHLLSHCRSCGQTRPQTAARLFVAEMVSYAPSKSPSLTLEMNSGMRTLTGQPFTHCGFLQFRQRWASSIAVAAL